MFHQRFGREHSIGPSMQLMCIATYILKCVYIPFSFCNRITCITFGIFIDFRGPRVLFGPLNHTRSLLNCFHLNWNYSMAFLVFKVVPMLWSGHCVFITGNGSINSRTWAVYRPGSPVCMLDVRYEYMMVCCVLIPETAFILFSLR